MDQAALKPAAKLAQLPSLAPPAVQAGWWVVGAAVQGVSHERLDLPCQDAFAYRPLENGLLLIAVADGAGTARFADAGARRIVDETLNALETLLETSGASLAPQDCKTLMLEAFGAARQSVWQMAEDESQPAREYAATLACVIASDGWLVAGQVGDGAVVVDGGAEQQEQLSLVVRLQRGEYANETQFLTQADALEQAVIEIVEQPVRALAVMSDGLIRLALKLPAQEPHAPFFQPLFRFADLHKARLPVDAQAPAADQLAAFLRSERVNARTDDDKTLVLAVRIYQQEQSRADSEFEQGAQQ